MTAGAAASEPKPPCSIIATTTYFGCANGAHDAYHESSSQVRQVCAVPVLPATGIGKFANTYAEVPDGSCAAS